MDVTARLLELLLAGASREEVEALATGEEQTALAGRLHDELARMRGREAELSALNETARDLATIRDLDAILTAIVRRARQLLRADMTYLSLNDEADGASFMKVTDGALTPEFRRLRLPLGTGLLGLVAQAGEPYFTEDYQADERFVHRDFIDSAVAGEQIRAILGVPLTVDGVVIGALLAVHRRVRPFPPGEVALLSAFASHAAVALENARLFEQVRDANAELRTRSEATERAALAHDRLTDVLLRGGGVVEVAGVLGEVLGGRLGVRDDAGRLLAGEDLAGPGLDEAVAAARASGRCVRTDDDAWVAVATAGEELLGTLVLRPEEPLDQTERRTLERGALVTALVLLFVRSEAEAENRVRGELLADLLAGREADAGRLRERARQQGADLDAAVAVAVAEPTDRQDPQVGRVVASLGREHGGLGGLHEGRAVLVAPGDPLDLGRLLAQRLDGATVGVAASTGGADAVAPAWAAARQCLEALVRLGRTGTVSDPAGLGLARLLLGDNGPEELEEFIAATLGPVLHYDAERDTRLVETLDAWFEAGGALRETAARLHVHANTVSQRLDRVGQLLGEDWRSPDRRLDLHLALRLVRLRDV